MKKLLKRTQENEKLMEQIKEILKTPQVNSEQILQRVEKLVQENKEFREEREKLLKILWDNLQRYPVTYMKGKVIISSLCLSPELFLCSFSKELKNELRLMDGSIWEFCKNLEKKGFVKIEGGETDGKRISLP